jgi:hypothetical protein
VNIVDQYLNPSSEICHAVDKLDIYYQMTNQKVVELYLEYKNKNSYSGNLWDYFKMEDAKHYFIGQNKIFGVLKTALYLLKNIEEQVNTNLFAMLNKEELTNFVSLIQEYPVNRKTVEDWVKPLSDKDMVKRAVDDALNIDLDKFHFLELATIDRNHKTIKMSLFSKILQVEDINTLVNYLSSQTEYKDCFMLTVVKNKKRNWKSTFYMLFIYNGILYSIDNSDGRVNTDNTEGDRSPDRYLESKYEDIWLPLHLILGKSNKKSEALTTTDKGLYVVSTFEELENTSPENVYWFLFFMGRVMDLIENKELKIQKAFMSSDVQKLLGSGEKIEYKAESCTSVSSGEYLLDIYKDVANKDIVLAEGAIDLVVATKEHAMAVVAYKRRQSLCKEIQKAVNADYKKNHKSVYKWVSEFVHAQDKYKFVFKALQNKQYSYMYYAQFGTDRGIGDHPNAIDIGELRKKNILREDKYFESDNALNIFLSNRWKQRGRTFECMFHPKFKYHTRYNLRFDDWREFVEFFEIKEDDIPIQMKQHLHQHSDLYTGNSILDDTDPLDEINDPWFLKDGKRWMPVRGHEHPEINVIFEICGHCIKKMTPKI